MISHEFYKYIRDIIFLIKLYNLLWKISDLFKFIQFLTRRYNDYK